MQPLSNEQTLRGFNREEDRARGEVFNRYHDALLTMIRKITQNSPDAEDLVNDTFEVLYEKKREFNSLGELRDFVFQTGKNISINYLVNKGKIQQSHDELQQQLPYTDLHFDADMCYSETRRLIYERIENLPNKQRAVFRLRYFDDLPNDEVARQLNIAVQTAYNRYSKARQKLKWDLEKIQRFTVYLLNLFI